ncbi:MAG: DNA polymerase III subunit beta [Clostridia bacterium]
MHVICEGLDLSEAIIKVSKAISGKSTNPILEGIKLTAAYNELTLAATDLELAIEKKIKADIKIEGETIIPGKFFSDFVKKLTNEQIELILSEKNQLTIKYGDNESQIQCFSSTEYPVLKKIDSGEFFALSQFDLKNLIKKSIFSVAIDDSRPILKGCLFEIEQQMVSAVSLDGYRLALVKKNLVECTIKNNVIIPSRSLNEISNILSDTDEIVNVYVQKNYMMVDLKNTKVITRLLEGEFLAYKQIIAKDFSSIISINKSQFEDSLERVSLLSRIGQNNLVKLELKENTMVLTSNSEIGKIEEILPINFSGKELSIAFNARYFLEAMRVIDEETIKIKFNSPNNPCIITAMESDEFLYLILPVRMIN